MLNLQPRKFASRAESLIETLVAITVIVVSTASAMILIRTSLIGNEVIGEKIVALNLGLEAIEAVKNIRDTNYLTMASDPENCWNTLGVITDVADCAGASTSDEVIKDGETYYLVRNFGSDATANQFEWNMVPATDTDKDGWLNLYESALDEGVMEGETAQLYAGEDSDAESFSFEIVDGGEHAYQRLLSISYNGTDAFDVTVTINWEVRGEAKSLSLTRTIANVY